MSAHEVIDAATGQLAELSPPPVDLALATLPEQINHALLDAEKHLGAATAAALRAGELLTRAKALVKHGEWEQWVREHVTCAPRTAAAYMRLYSKLPQLPEQIRNGVADLPLRDVMKAIATRPKDGDDTPKPNYPKWVRARSKTEMERLHAELGDAATKLRTVSRNIGANALQRKDLERARKALAHPLEVLDKLAAAEAAPAPVKKTSIPEVGPTNRDVINYLLGSGRWNKNDDDGMLANTSGDLCFDFSSYTDRNGVESLDLEEWARVYPRLNLLGRSVEIKVKKVSRDEALDNFRRLEAAMRQALALIEGAAS